MLIINNLVFRIGGRVLFDDASVTVADGQHVGLVGRNGSGKTTLFKILTEEVSYDGGSIFLSPKTRIGILPQEPPFLDMSVLQYVLDADVERKNLLKDVENESLDAETIASIHERLAAIESHSAEARAASILCGLGFKSDEQNRSLKEFSGGWRMRVALAGLLFSRPDLMLLDEPTNHLDFESSAWLEGFLARYEGTIILISHDKTLLNRAVSRIIHLDNLKLVGYGGGYDEFEKTRKMKMMLAGKAYEKQLEEKKHITAFVDRFRYKASKARQAQSRIKMLERMEPLVPIIEDSSVRINFPEPEDLAPPLIMLENASAGYGEKPVIKRLNLRIDMDDRIALLGLNGNGKSTLARLISDRLKPLSGEVRRSRSLRIGYFSQERTEELNSKETPIYHVKKLMKDANETAVRGYLGRFSIGENLANLDVEKLSGGEKTRLLLALVCFNNPHVLVLDEPTNHLDIDTRNSLCEALNLFKGAVILITHDASMIETTVDNIWLVDNGTCVPFDGDINEYRQMVIDATQKKDDSNKESLGSQKKQERREKAALRESLAPLRKEIKKLESEIEKLTKKKQEIEKVLADVDFYNKAEGAEIARYNFSLSEVVKKTNELEEEWLSKVEIIENSGINYKE